MFLRRLKDVTKNTYFLRCISDVLKTSQKRYLFWDVSERSLRYLSQWRSDTDLSETSHAGWDNLSFADVIQNRSSLKCLNIHRKTPELDSLFNKVRSLQTSNFVKKWLQRRCFPENVVNFLRTYFSIEHPQWLLSRLLEREEEESVEQRSEETFSKWKKKMKTFHSFSTRKFWC